MSNSEGMLSILFAEVAGSERLLDAIGGAEAVHAVDRCMKRVTRAIDGFHGRIVKSGRDEIVALFDNAGEACQAAIAVQRRIADLPPVFGTQILIRVGFEHGYVVEEAGVVSGQCLDAAESLARRAAPGQILVAGPTQKLLSGHLQATTRSLGDESTSGSERELFEVLWVEPRSEVTQPRARASTQTREREARLCVRYRDYVKLLDRHRSSVVMGRDKTCEITIRDRRASRNHARIERQGAQFVLTDTSTNGTFVTVNGEQELFIRHDQFVLHGSGIISFAASAGSAGADTAEFEHF